MSARDLGGDLLQGGENRIQFLFGGVAEFGAARREQHLGLEYEAIALDADTRAVAEDLAQPTEEFRAIAPQLLDLFDEGKVEFLPKLGDLALLRLDLLLARCRAPRRCGSAARATPRSAH